MSPTPSVCAIWCQWYHPFCQLVPECLYPDTTFLSFPLEVLSAAQTVVPEKQCDKYISLCMPYTWRETKAGSLQDVSDPWFLCPHFPCVSLLTQGVWPYKCSHASVSCLSLGNRQWVLPFAIQSVLPEVAGTLSDPAEAMHREELSFHLQGEGGRCASSLTPDPRGCCPDSTAFLGEVRPFMKPLLKNCSACEGTASALQWGTRYLSHRELMWDTSCLYAAHEARKVYLLLELLLDF